MAATLIATTRQSDLEPLGTGGQSAISAAPTLRAALTRALSPDHAALFAEPVANPARGEIDWYADVGESPVPLPDLPVPAQAAARAEYMRIGGDIRELAGKLASAPGETDRFLGAMLNIALTVPDEFHVRVSGGRPVLIGWGHRDAGPRHPNPLVIGVVPVAVERMGILPPPHRFLPVASVPRGYPDWLWWLAVAAAALLWVFPAWLLADAFAAPAPCRVAAPDLAMMQRLTVAQATGAALAARLESLRAASQVPCATSTAPKP